MAGKIEIQKTFSHFFCISWRFFKNHSLEQKQNQTPKQSLEGAKQYAIKITKELSTPGLDKQKLFIHLRLQINIKQIRAKTIKLKLNNAKNKLPLHFLIKYE